MSIVVEKEYYKLSTDKPTIGVVMMVKNECLRIRVTLHSIIGYADALIMYDTGSIDNTIKIIKTFSKKQKINLYLIKGIFVDYSTSRNVVLEYADKINVHYLLLLDCNDQLQGGAQLRQYAEDVFSKPNSAFLTCQQWWSGKIDRYFNVRFIKARHGWKYEGSVHEWLENPEYTETVLRMPDSIVLYQDRTKDDNKTKNRFITDKELLLLDYKKDRTNTRTLFYLSQTCMCLQHYEDAYYYSRLRVELNGFEEEKYHSYLRCGQAASALGHSWYDVMTWYIRAYEHSERVEALIYIIEHYNCERNWHMAYLFSHRACELSYPQYCLLFVDKSAYEYKRWHFLGTVAYYVGKLEEGKDACIKAINAGNNKEIDKKNLQFYM